MWFLSWTISSLQKKLAEVDIPTGFLQFSIKFFGLLILVSLLNLHQPPVKSFVADLTNSLQLNFRNSTIFWLGLTSLEPFSIKLHIVIIFLLLSFLIISLCMMICFLPPFFFMNTAITWVLFMEYEDAFIFRCFFHRAHTMNDCSICGIWEVTPSIFYLFFFCPVFLDFVFFFLFYMRSYT